MTPVDPSSVEDEGVGEAVEAAAAGEPEEAASGPMALEARLRRLDEIVAALEADDVGLDRGLELFEEGVGHIRSAERMLEAAELKVEELIGSGDRAETRPLDETE